MTADVVPPASVGGRVLWPHQQRAVDRWCGQVRDGQRGTVVAACGTGKTLVAADASVRVAAHEPVVMMVPTVDLLAQTVKQWQDYLGPAMGRVVAVCNIRQMQHTARQAGVSLRSLTVTTDPAQLAALMADGRVTVLATYASLPVVRAAYRLHDARPAGLLVVDEAHRTAGPLGKAWAAVHDQVAVPARRRLYMTATPRIFLDDQPAISMDDQTVFGPVAFRLGFADAISLGLLADYRLVVAVVTEQELADLAGFAGTTGEQPTLTVAGRPRPARMLASQIALSRAIADYQLSRVLVYHNRVASAALFAHTLPDAVSLLPAAEAPTRPVRGWSASGKSNFAHRAQVLRHLRDPGDNAVVVCNARLFSEGLDVPALDAVMYAEPRTSLIDVVQGVGRSLRLGGQPQKTATIVVPVLTSEATLANELAHRDWQHVWQVVRALRAHDERLEARLDQARSGTRRGEGNIGGLADTAGAAVGLSWLTAAGPRVPAGFADRIRLRVLNPVPAANQDAWDRYYPLAQAFHAEHGHLRVPHVQTDDGWLGSWLAHQRRLYTAGNLAPDRIAALERLHIIWDPVEEQWHSRYAEHLQWTQRQASGAADTAPDSLRQWWTAQRAHRRAGTLPETRRQLLDKAGFDWDPQTTEWQDGLRHARAYRQRYGHLQVPSNYTSDDGFNLGTWITNRRSDHKRGRLKAERTAELDQLDMIWDCRAHRWQQHLAAARAYHTEHGTLRGAGTVNGHNVSLWLTTARARHRNGDLTADQITDLDALGIDWNPHPGPPTTA
ncbi:DEAD/DEAH box helicase [Phytohabitans houttuyneae]|uniref:Helicase n=1 Tax=Phytohabitans houttuyneae TaxID=1076126 RepID=A0A6V8KJ98_9ACTN|nr:DEAD/DEAH box helicase [Phytohabitans houttuyneae]GFJ82056.1 helicase [Phytohabitans houttuyneae]